MSQAQIYDNDDERLADILREAGNERGATLLIPDLQRPFVWTPAQVTLLVDSLLHGWPFGTLLLWKVAGDDLASIPSRTFWRVVDRTDAGGGASEAEKHPPGSFRMVLDGQQRIQSLVLAFGGDAGGFRLTDRQWLEGLELERPRGRPQRHWSYGQLCLDLTKFRALTQSGIRVRDIDYRDVLRWVVCAAKDGSSPGARPANYRYPLKVASATPGRFLRLSRLWTLASATPTSEYDYEDRLRDDFLPSEQVTSDVPSLVRPMAQLTKILEEVKMAKVGMLVLREFDEGRGDKLERYGDAIVNIFTRLNTAGRTLTREEITFAWIKTNWKPDRAEVPAAVRAFSTLRADLTDRGVSLSTDELVQAVALAWAVLCNDGSPLGPKDLLRGELVKPMVPEIARRWPQISGNFIRTADALREQEVIYGQHYQSLNAFVLLALCRLLGVEWLANRKMGVMERDRSEKSLDDLVRRYAERWLALTSWAGVWREGSREAVSRYLKELAGLWQVVRAADSIGSVIALAEQRITDWLSTAAPQAESFIKDGLAVDRRDEVRTYFLPLWVWHRMDESRWGISSLHLAKARAKVSTDVDHIVAVALWSRLAAASPSSRAYDPDVAVHDIGNGFLLQKNFNIAKSDRSLESFLDDVHEIRNRSVTRIDFYNALRIEPAMADPERASPEIVAAAILERGRRIRADLIEYVYGRRSSGPAALISVGGRWRGEVTHDGQPDNVILDLVQVGRSVEGQYSYGDGDGDGGTLDGEMRGNVLQADWAEGRKKGSLSVTFNVDATAFEGSWTYTGGASGGEWSGHWEGPTPSSTPSEPLQSESSS